MTKKKTKKKPTTRTHVKNIALDDETLGHIEGYMKVWGNSLDYIQLQRYKKGKRKDKYYGLAKIISKTIT